MTDYRVSKLFFDLHHDAGLAREYRADMGSVIDRYQLILLQKSLMVSTINDSLALTRFVAEAGDDGAAQS